MLSQIASNRSRLGGSSNRVGLAVLAVALVVFFELTAGDFRP